MDQLLLKARQALAAARPKERKLRVVGAEGKAPEVTLPCAQVLHFTPRGGMEAERARTDRSAGVTRGMFGGD